MDRVRELNRISYELRQAALEMVYNAKTGHLAPCYSIAEIMAVLYFDVLNLDPQQPRWPGRDRMVLSKGHASPIYYAALAKRGFFPEDELLEYRALNSKLQGHPDMRKCPGVDMTTGSLGNGVSAALGMALIGKKDTGDYNVYAIAGDGEMQEGIVWEAMMYAGNRALDNLVVVIDNNGLQSGGMVRDIQDLSNLDAKLRASKWSAITVDGHDVEAIRTALKQAKETSGAPTAIIANTVKGKGVSFIENQYLWHMKAPNTEEYQMAKQELEKAVVQYA